MSFFANMTEKQKLLLLDGSPQSLQQAGINISSGYGVQQGELVTASMAGDIYNWYVTAWSATGRSMPKHRRISGPFLSQNAAISEKERIKAGKPPTKPMATTDPVQNLLIGRVLEQQQQQQQKPEVEVELVAAPSGTAVVTAAPAAPKPKPKTGTALALGAAAVAAFFFLK